MKTITICGGGNLGHVVAAYLAAKDGLEVRLLTRKPALWHSELLLRLPDGDSQTARLAAVTDDARRAVSGADMVLLCLPGYSIAPVLATIAPHLAHTTLVGSVVSSTGFFDQALSLLPAHSQLFGFQRVPFIARTEVYGSIACLLGRKQLLRVATEGVEAPQSFADSLASLLDTPVELLSSRYEASLSNSNPLLHPARLYSLWHDWQPGTVYPRCPMFYAEWTDEASRIYVAMDDELHGLIRRLPMPADSLPSVLSYYESDTVEALTAKLRSIEAFRAIAAPMMECDGGYAPDLGSRYFKEDFPYGLDLLIRLAHNCGLEVPTMQMVARWGKKMIDYGKQ